MKAASRGMRVVGGASARDEPGRTCGLALMTGVDTEGAVMAIAQKVRIAYDDIGVGDPAVVLLHGMLANRSYYAAQAQHLAARHRVLSIDLRGHGSSDAPVDGHSYSLDTLADDVVRVCEEAGVARAVFCGHSFPVALKAALQES